MVINNNQNRAVLDGCWSPYGEKFAFGTGSYKLYLGYVDQANGWWIAENLSPKKFSASVISVAFHPSGNVVAAGTADGKVRLYTSFVEGDVAYTDGPFSNIQTKGEELYRFEIGSWVESISWAPSGKFALFSGHNSTVHKLIVGDGDQLSEEENVIVWDNLPFRSTFMFDDNSFYAGGYDKKPVAFKFKNGKWERTKTFEKEGKMVVKKTIVQSNLDMFESGKMSQGPQTIEIREEHTNPIICMRKGAEKKLFYSIDSHGNFFVWID